MSTDTDIDVSFVMTVYNKEYYLPSVRGHNQTNDPRSA